MIGLLRTSILLTTFSFVHIHAFIIKDCVVSCAGEPDGYYPSCEGCDKFVQCASGVAYVKTCAGGLFWNPGRNACDFETITPNCPDTSSSTTTTTTPAADDGYLQWCHSEGLYVRGLVEETECLYDMGLNNLATLEETILSPNHEGAGIACIKGVTWGFRDITNEYGSTRRQLYTKGGCCGTFRITLMM